MAVTTTYAAEFVSAAEIASSNVGMAITSLAGGGLAGLGEDGPSLDVVILNDSLNPIGFSSNVPGANGALDQLSNGNIVVAAESGGTLNYRIIDAAGDEVRADTAVSDSGLTVEGVAALTGAGAGFVVATTDLVAPGTTTSRSGCSTRRATSSHRWAW